MGEIENGEPNGQGISTSPDGHKYLGEFKNENEHGQGTDSLPDRSNYI